MRYNTIIFDMDGTIIDTEHIWKQATKDLIEAHGHQLANTQELEYAIHGLSLIKSCQLIKDFFTLPETLEELIQEKSNRAMALYKQDLRFIDGFVSFHQNVKQQQLKHAIATNADDVTIAVTDKALNLHTYFGEHIYGISKVNNICKPAPDLFLLAADKLQSDPATCIVIEDSAHGVHAAKAAGMFCIGINSAGKPEQIKDADLLVNCYNEIDIVKLLS